MFYEMHRKPLSQAPFEPVNVGLEFAENWENQVSGSWALLNEYYLFHFAVNEGADYRYRGKIGFSNV